ncbi:unnamed protein product [Rotaria magnacalcarata]
MDISAFIPPDIDANGQEEDQRADPSLGTAIVNTQILTIFNYKGNQVYVYGALSNENENKLTPQKWIFYFVPIMMPVQMADDPNGSWVISVRNEVRAKLMLSNTDVEVLALKAIEKKYAPDEFQYSKFWTVAPLMIDSIKAYVVKGGNSPVEGVYSNPITHPNGQEIIFRKDLIISTINSVPCFLLTNDPCEVLNLNIDDDALNVLKGKICFPLSDGSFIVKPGFKTGFICLRDLLSKKTEERLKQLRSTKTQSTTAAPMNNIPSSSPSSSPSLTPPRTTIASAPQIAASPSSDIVATPIMEHRRYFLNLLKSWCSNHKDDFLSDSFDLNEGKDFILNVLYDQNNDLKVNVKCNCNKSITLAMKDDARTTVSQTNSRKRSHESSQFSSSQKRKKNRT